MATLLSDHEYASWWHSKFSVTCKICGDLSTHTSFLGRCSSHVMCYDCIRHAKQSHVTECPLCPVPDQTLHMKCIHCKHEQHLYKQKKEGLLKNVWTCSACQTCQPMNLLRIFKRNNCFTNYLTQDEKSSLLLMQPHEILKCPCCQACIHRQEACNEMHHCGKQSSCAACGSFSFPWEDSLAFHRRESGCKFIIQQDDTALRQGEDEARHERFYRLVVHAQS